MRFLFKSLFLVIFSVCLVNADLGIPQIQAICKVTLKNGKEVQGIILLSRGGYGNKYQPDGFCFVHENGNYQLLLFKLDYSKFTPNNYGAYKAGTSQLRFATSITTPQRSEVIVASKEVGEEVILERTTEERERFQLLKHIPLFKELPLTLYVNSNEAKPEDLLNIAVEDLDSFELVKDPSEYWINEIRSKREALREKMIEDEKAGREWVDYMEPAWFHEILKDKKQFNNLRQYFK